MTSASPELRKKHNRDYYLRGGARKIRARSRDHRERNKQYVNGIKATTPCTDCEKNWPPYVMQFDHIGTDKEANVSKLVNVPASIARIDREIAKCELVCANCHAVRTHERLQASLA